MYMKRRGRPPKYGRGRPKKGEVRYRKPKLTFTEHEALALERRRRRQIKEFIRHHGDPPEVRIRKPGNYVRHHAADGVSGTRTYPRFVTVKSYMTNERRKRLDRMQGVRDNLVALWAKHDATTEDKFRSARAAHWMDSMIRRYAWAAHNALPDPPQFKRRDAIAYRAGVQTMGATWAAFNSTGTFTNGFPEFDTDDTELSDDQVQAVLAHLVG